MCSTEIEGDARTRGVVHGEHDAGDQLDGQGQAGKHAEIPEIIEVAGDRIASAHRIVDEARERKPLVDPLHQRILGFVMLSPGKAHYLRPQPTRMAVSEVYLYSGTSRFFGPGPYGCGRRYRATEPWQGQK